ncbi:MAG: zinc ribbon domain-containing protein [Lachnospiraceae bacterium]|nr:zinc ribbon domain-containing protein [Lachnospiraceae bacterium]
MYYCTNCGFQIVDDLDICPKCGSVKPACLNNQPEGNSTVNLLENEPSSEHVTQINGAKVSDSDTDAEPTPVPIPVVEPTPEEQTLYNQQIMYQPQAQPVQPQFTPQSAPQPMQMQQPMGQPAFAPQPMQMQQPIYGNSQQFTKPKTNIAKLIFELAALLCSILVIAQLFMPLVAVERGKNDEEISVYEAIMNSIDSIDDIDFDKDDTSTIFAIIASLSSLLGLFAIISAIIVFISKIIALVNIKKSNKIKLGGIYSLFSLQLAYLLFGNLLLFTHSDTVENYLFTDMEFSMLVGWMVPTIIIGATTLYGVIIGFLFNKNDNEKLSSPKNIINALFGLVSAIIAVIGVFTATSVWYKLVEVEMTTTGTVYSIYLLFYEAAKKYVEFEEILPVISMMIGGFLFTILAFTMFDCTVKNSLIAIANKKFSSISCCIMSIFSILSIYINQTLFNMLDEYKIEYESGAEITFTTKTKSIVTTLLILAIVLLILSIIHIILNNTVFAKKSVPMQNMNPYMQMNGMNNMNGMPNMQYGNMPMNNMNGFNNVPNGQFQNPNQNQPMNYK